MTDILFGKKHIHFIGIGGAGMIALVEILYGNEYIITGSDNNESDNVAKLREMGIKVFMGHNAENIKGADLIVYTAAVHEDNAELSQARKQGIECIERGPLLGVLSRRYPKCAAISGTHGKTTASSMLTQALVMAKAEPTAVIGGKLPYIGGNALRGTSDIFVCEACEYVNSYHSISPYLAVILNIDCDHLEFFKTVDNLIASFRKFADSSSKYIIYNGDDEKTLKAVNGLNKELITFGLSEKNDYYAKDIKVDEKAQTTFAVMSKGDRLADIALKVPGEHNVINALAAFAAAVTLGLSHEAAAEGISAFTGAHRRFERLGEFNGVIVADDYAHHPAELTATLKAAKTCGFKKVWAVFQPFTFSRTYMLLDDFADALKIADRVVLSPIMGSREKNTYGIYSSDLADKINGAIVFNTFEEIADYVRENAEAGDLVLTLGCGDIYKAAKLMLK